MVRPQAIIAGLVILWAVAACTPAMPTATPSATATTSSTVTTTPTVTTLPWPTHVPLTPTPVATPTSIVPPFTAIMVRACVDADDDAECSLGEMPVTVEVLLCYDYGIQERLCYAVTTGAGGLGIHVGPGGLYNPIVLRDYSAPIKVAPDYRQTVAIVCNAGVTCDLHLPFVSREPVPTPTPGTPTPTPAPLPYACPAYQTMCRQTCDGAFEVDPLGLCGSGFLCCRPRATATVVSAQIVATPTTVPGMIPTWQPTPEGKTGPCCYPQETPVAIAGERDPCAPPYAEPVSLYCCSDETRLETCRPWRCCGYTP